MRSDRKIAKMRKALVLSNTRLLLTTVIIFQALAMLLLVLNPDHTGTRFLCIAAAVPIGTFVIVNVLGKIWPVDRALLILILLLVSVGIITLSAVCRSETTAFTHAMYAAGGIVAMLIAIIAIRNFTNWKHWTTLLMILCLGALLSPWVLGSWYQGARNWIYLGPLSAQPSEFMKPILIIILASFFSNRPSFARCLPAIIFAAVCCAILLTERDLGALLLYFLTTVFMYYAATSNMVLSLAGLGMGAGSAVVAYNLFPYVRDRISIWQNPWSDPLNSGYQIVQALIAIGSGGLFGMGLGLGSPRQVPLYHSDFIFTSIAEEFGLIFSVGLMAIYVVIIFRGLNIAMNARTSFHSLTAFGIVTIMGLQALLIIGGNTKLLPLTGVTLPLISYGGSSLMSSFFSMGILLGISSLNAEDERRDLEKLAVLEDVGL